MTPLFSVVIPLYNKEKYIEATIESVTNQTYKNFEIIVVNDGSTDKSVLVLESINNERIKLVSQENLGLSAARNTGIKNAKGQYVAFLDADDLWQNDFLQTIYLLILKHKKKEKIYATNYAIWPKERLPKLISKPIIVNDSEVLKNYFTFQKNLFSYSSIVFQTSIFDELGYFNEDVNYGEEEEFSIKCFQKYNLVYYPQPKVFYRTGIKNQLTAPYKNSNRVTPNYEHYLDKYTNPDLKKYIDFVHYKLVILYKMELNHEKVKFYKSKIDSSNLSLVKKVKYYLPTNLFYLIKTIYQWF